MSTQDIPMNVPIYIYIYISHTTTLQVLGGPALINEGFKST